MAKRMPWLIPTGLFIRDFLMAYKEAYAYEVWRALRETRKSAGLTWPEYRSFWNQWRILEKLGLIRLVRVERGLGRYYRRYYSITPGFEDHPAWRHPQIAYNPITWLGRRKYRRVREIAERERVRIGTAFVRTHPEKVRELAEELRVTEAEIRRRATRGRARRS
jgi:DNA-binding PadR family transcriptional regulator